MRRHAVRAAFALAIAAAVTACGNDHALPTAVPGPAGVAALTLAQNGCYLEGTGGRPTFTQVDTRVKNLINALFTGDNLQSSLSMWENMKKDKLFSQPLQSHTDNITKFVLTQLGVGSLRSPGLTLDPPEGALTTTTGAVRLLDLIFTCVNLTPTSLPPVPSGFDAAFVLVSATANVDQQFNTSFKDAAAFLKSGVLDANSMLVVTRQTPDVQVNTPFRKLSRTIDIALAGGKLKEGQTVSVLVCPSPEFPDVDEVSHRGVIAHQKTPFKPGDPIGQGVEYLPPPDGGALPCPESVDVGMAWREEKGFFRQRTMQVASFVQKAWSYIGPKPLYAGHAAIGGSIGFFSPVVLVDPYVGTELVVDPITAVTYGQAVAVSGTLKVTSGPAAWVGQAVTSSLPGMPTPLTSASLQITTTLDDGKTQTLPIGADGKVSFSFTHVNAGNAHNAQLSFPLTRNLPAYAPLFGASGDADNAFVVNPAPLDITAAPATRAYGDADPALTGSIVGEVYDEDGKITAQYKTDATIESEITTESRVYQTLVTDGSIAPLSGSGVLLSNYDIHTHAGVFTITPRNLTGHVTPAARAYGEPNPTFTPWTHGTGSPSVTLDNPVSFDDGLVVNLGTGAVTTSGVGDYPIVATLAGSHTANYVNGITAGALSISKRLLVGGLDQAEASIVYGDAVPAEFSGSLQANVGGVFKPALVGGDGVESAFRSDATAGSGVTDYPITLRLTGAAASNYDASGVGSGTLHITKRGLTGAIDPKSKNQGADNPPLTGSVGNNVAGDGFLVTYVTPATPASEVGDYPITVDLTVAGGQNYSWNAANDGTLTVTEPPPTLAGALTIDPTSIAGGTTTALVVQLPSLASGSAATVSLTISGCGAISSVPKVGGSAITAADLGTSISIDPPLSVATDTKTCTYTLTVSNAANPPGTATSTATLDIVPAQ